MKNTPRGCLTAGGAKPPRVTPYISIQLVSVCKHSNLGGSRAAGGEEHPKERGWVGSECLRTGSYSLRFAKVLED